MGKKHKKNKHLIEQWFEAEWKRDHAEAPLKPCVWRYETSDVLYLTVTGKNLSKKHPVYHWSFDFWGEDGYSETLYDAMKSAIDYYDEYLDSQNEKDDE